MAVSCPRSYLALARIYNAHMMTFHRTRREHERLLCSRFSFGGRSNRSDRTEFVRLIVNWHKPTVNKAPTDNVEIKSEKGRRLSHSQTLLSFWSPPAAIMLSIVYTQHLYARHSLYFFPYPTVSYYTLLLLLSSATRSIGFMQVVPETPQRLQKRACQKLVLEQTPGDSF